MLTEKRMQVLSWYTALGSEEGSSTFSALALSPVKIDCNKVKFKLVSNMMECTSDISRQKFEPAVRSRLGRRPKLSLTPVQKIHSLTLLDMQLPY